MRKPKVVQKQSLRIHPNRLKTRDMMIVGLITGANKTGVQVDRKKEAARQACRSSEEEE